MTNPLMPGTATEAGQRLALDRATVSLGNRMRVVEGSAYRTGWLVLRVPMLGNGIVRLGIFVSSSQV